MRSHPPLLSVRLIVVACLVEVVRTIVPPHPPRPCQACSLNAKCRLGVSMSTGRGHCAARRARHHGRRRGRDADSRGGAQQHVARGRCRGAGQDRARASSVLGSVVWRLSNVQLQLEVAIWTSALHLFTFTSTHPGRTDNHGLRAAFEQRGRVGVYDT